MPTARHRVAIVGCGSHGEYVTRVYHAFPDTEIVAIVERNPVRLREMGEAFGVKALYADVESLLRDEVPELAVVVTPVKQFKEIVVACAEAGVKGLSTDKPMAAVLADADAMVQVCQERGVVYAGGTMQPAAFEVHEAAQRLHRGEFGTLQGAWVRRLGMEISGGGCQTIGVLRLMAGAEVVEVMTWAMPGPGIAADMLTADRDVGWMFGGRFRLSNGLECPVHGADRGGLEVWTEEALMSWNWEPPEIYVGYENDGTRRRIDPDYAPNPYPQFVSSSVGTARSFIDAVETGSEPWVTGHDMRQALEVAIACAHSARLGSVPVSLPLADRSLALYPSTYRWEGASAAGRFPLL